MSVDFRELEEFRDKLQKLADKDTSKLCDDCAKELAGRLLAKVVKRTPVGVVPEGIDKKSDTYKDYWSGYTGGTLRRGWTSGKNVNATQYAKTMPVNHIGQNHKIEIINQVEYAQYVEYGHRQTPGRFVPALGKRLTTSWVNGKFMMTKSESEVDAIAQRVVDKKVNDYLERYLGGK